MEYKFNDFRDYYFGLQMYPILLGKEIEGMTIEEYVEHMFELFGEEYVIKCEAELLEYIVEKGYKLN